MQKGLPPSSARGWSTEQNDRTRRRARRARDYVAGDPEDHAVAEYRKIMRYPAAWAAARMQVSDGRPDEASVEEAYRRFCYMESRARIRDGYYVDRIAFEKWSRLTTHVEYDPVVPGSSDHRIWTSVSGAGGLEFLERLVSGAGARDPNSGVV